MNNIGKYWKILANKAHPSALPFTFVGRPVTNLWEKFNTYPANLPQQMEVINLCSYTCADPKAWQGIRENALLQLTKTSYGLIGHSVDQSTVHETKTTYNPLQFKTLQKKQLRERFIKKKEEKE